MTFKAYSCAIPRGHSEYIPTNVCYALDSERIGSINAHFSHDNKWVLSEGDTGNRWRGEKGDDESGRELCWGREGKGRREEKG